jgi:hypothetical protein
LDVDLDGVIDLYDKCVTVPGPVENQGCPYPSNSTTGIVTDEDRMIKGIEFDLDSDRILPSILQFWHRLSVILMHLIPALRLLEVQIQEVQKSIIKVFQKEELRMLKII